MFPTVISADAASARATVPVAPTRFAAVRPLFGSLHPSVRFGDSFESSPTSALDFSGQDLTGEAFGRIARQPHLMGAQLVEAILTGQDMNGKKCDGAVFNGVTWRHGSMAYAVLNDAKFNPSLHGKRADLSHTYMNGVRMDRAEFIEAILDHAVLSNAEGDKAVFRKASMKNSNLSFSQLPRAVFDGADLSGADLRSLQGNDRDYAVNRFTKAKHARQHAASFKAARLHGADLLGANLIGADLSGAKLTALGPEFPHPASLYNTHLEFANLSRADLSGVLFEKIWLRNANLTGAILPGANFTTLESEEMIHGVNFSNATLTDANFEGMALRGVNFKKAALEGANFSKATLNRLAMQEARLQGAQLAGAKLHGTVLSGAKLQGANLEGAELLGTDLRDAVIDADTHLNGAKYNRHTKFPAGFEPPDTMIYVPDILDKLPGRGH